MPVLAQSAPPAAPTREEVQRQDLERSLRTPEGALAIDGGVERAPCPLADKQFANLRFTLAEAQFTGLGSLDPSVLEPSWQPYRGKEIPVAVICDIRDRAATILRQRGYLAAVQVPVQTISDGDVRFDVVVARLASVQVRGDAGRSAGLLGRYIAKLQTQEAFNTNDAERYLLLARDIPGLDVRLTLQPVSRQEGGQPGDVAGVFDVLEQPIQIDANVQNYGSKAVGRFGAQLRALVNNLTGLGDQTMLSFYSAEDFSEQHVAQASHEFRVGSEGLTLGSALTFSWSRPDIPGPDDFDSKTLIASIFARYPLLRSQTRNLELSAGGDLVNQKIDFTGLGLSKDKLRTAFVRAQYSAIDAASVAGRGGYSVAEPRSGFSSLLELRQGIDLIGASKPCGPGFVNCAPGGPLPPSRLDGDPTGFVVRGEARLEQRVSPLVGLRGAVRFQYSPDPLLPFEQFSGGNYTIGRGYDPGAVLGDSGFGVQLEGFYGSLVPKTPDGIAIQPYVFGDYVGSWTNNLADDYSKLLSAGGGLRATIGRQASLDLNAAVPLKTPPFATRKGDVRVLMSLSIQLAPWYK